MARWRHRFGNIGILAIWIILLELCSELTISQEFHPLTISIERNWLIPEDKGVGTELTTARVEEAPDPNLEFTLEPSDTWGGQKDGMDFFRINSSSGVIYLKESIQGKSGTQFALTVQARIGNGIPIKIVLNIQITNARGSSSTSNITQGPGPVTDRGSVIPPRPPWAKLPTNTGGTVHTSSPNSFPPFWTSPPSPKAVTTESSTAVTTVGTLSSQFPPISSNNTYYDLGGITIPLPILHMTSTSSSSSPIDLPSTWSTVVPTSTSSATSGEMVNSTSSVKEDGTNNIVIFTIVPIVLLFGLVPIVVASIWLVRRRTRVKKRPTKEMRKESAATSNSSMTLSSDGVSPTALREWIKQAQSNRYESWNPDGGEVNRWEFPRHHLQVGRILGEGCFGQVWQCEALNIDGKEGVSTVAVKTLKEGAGERERTDLLSELTVMKMLEPHPHVVRLLGACTEKDPLFLIMEYVALGKLQSFLRNSRSTHYYPNLHADSSSLSSKDLTAFCYQIARGMEYLASKGIIHRDLAARNILIDKERVCKVADFGFARDVVANHVYERKTDGRLPVRWMAPEALYDNIFTTKTDIWSFGVLMWEIVTLGSTPYPGISAAEVMRKVRDGYRLEKPDHCRRELYNIMFYCWAGNPEDRPTFPDLVNFLKHLLFSETDYIDLNRFPDHDYYNYMSNSTSGEKL